LSLILKFVLSFPWSHHSENRFSNLCRNLWQIFFDAVCKSACERVRDSRCFSRMRWARVARSLSLHIACWPPSLKLLARQPLNSEFLEKLMIASCAKFRSHRWPHGCMPYMVTLTSNHHRAVAEMCHAC
jgi:hypothetical protein